MRTTLDLEDDVIQAARELAALRGQTIGVVVSALARKGLETPGTAMRSRNGVPLLGRRPAGAARPTMKRVNELRDEA